MRTGPNGAKQPSTMQNYVKNAPLGPVLIRARIKYGGEIK